jgi:hypothetical protein
MTKLEQTFTSMAERLSKYYIIWTVFAACSHPVNSGEHEVRCLSLVTRCLRPCIWQVAVRPHVELNQIKM